MARMAFPRGGRDAFTRSYPERYDAANVDAEVAAERLTVVLWAATPVPSLVEKDGPGRRGEQGPGGERSGARGREACVIKSLRV